MTFYEWLEKHKSRKSNTGDLARDVISDSTSPVDETSFEQWRAYLVSKDACEEALRAFDKAWARYARNAQHIIHE